MPTATTYGINYSRDMLSALASSKALLGWFNWSNIRSSASSGEGLHFFFLQVGDLKGCDELDSGGAGSIEIYTSRQQIRCTCTVPVNTYIMSKSFKVVGQLTPSTTSAQAPTNC